MISTVSLSFDLTYTNPVTGALQPRGIVTDSTNYNGLGLDENARFIGQAKGYGVISFNGTVIEQHDTVSDPMIDLQNWDYVTQGVPTYYFDLPLDVNNNVANGVYTFNYSLRLVANNFLGLSILGAVTAPDILTVANNEWIYQFLEAGNTIQLDSGLALTSHNILTTSYSDPDSVFTISTPPALGNYTFFFDITNVQLSGVYSYAGCVQSPASVTFTYDCEVGTNGTFAVANATQLNGQTIIGLSATINYPAWTSTTPTFNSQIVTTSLPYSNNVLATGTFSVSLSQVIQRVQTDGLILQYISSSVQEFVVSCAGSLCNLIPCIESLRNAHATELQRNRISKYQVFVDNVLMYYTEAQNYRSCGDIENYRNTLALIEAQLDASGCECGCCDPNTYVWVNNNAASTIDTLINALQFRLVDGVPTTSDDSTKGVEVGALWEDVSGLPGTLGILYVCTVNTPSNAVWEVYFNPNEAPPGYDASDITYAGSALLPGPKVENALNEASDILTSQALSISNLSVSLAVTNAAVAGKLNAPSPQIVGGTKTKVTYDNNGLIVSGTTLSASDIPSGVLATKIGTGIVDNTEFGYLNGVTSNVQTQLNNKLPSSLTADTLLDYNNFKLTLANGTNQTDITKAQSASSSAPALTIQSRNSAATTGFGSSIQLSANLTGNATQVPLSTIRGSWTDAGNGDSKLSLSTTKGETESVQMEISNEGQIKLNQYNAGNFPDPAPAYLLGVNAAGNVVQTTAPAAVKYVAGIVDNIGSAFTIYGNTTGATITASGFGSTTITLTASSPVFTFGKTLVFFQGLSSVQTSTYTAFWTSTTTITISGYTNGVASWNNIIGAIKIEVYP